MRKLSVFLIILISSNLAAQKIVGTVYNEKGETLPYSSVTIKGTSIGASANNQAKFSFSVSPGTYMIVCQHIGYTKQEKKVTITTANEEITFILSNQKLLLKEVIVKSGGEDPAYEIIRHAIKKRSYYNDQVKGFTGDLYAKDIIKLRNLPKKIFGKKIPENDRKDMGLDSTGKGIIYLSESLAKVSIQHPDKFKMEVLSSRVSGSESFGFTFPTFISLYNNNVSVFTERLNPRGFISPIAEGAIHFYKYKYLGSFWEDGKEINSIRVIPRRKYEPLFSGTINISEGDWRIHSLDLILTKESQLEIIDTLQITQIHVPVAVDTWCVKNQLLHFNFKLFGIDAIGNFLNVYSNYSINPSFDKKFFNKMIIKYDTGVNKKTKEYWDTVRPVPLASEEKKDYEVKDSIYQLQKDSLLSRHSIDSLNKREGKLKVVDLFWKGLNHTHFSKTGNYNWEIESLLKSTEYNTVEGVVMNINGHFNQNIKKWKSTISLDPHFRYGFNNTHFNAWADVNFRTKDEGNGQKLKRQSWTIAGGKRVSQFNKESAVSPFFNSFGILFFGDNYMKTYENYFGSIGFAKRFESGLRFAVNTSYEDRIPLDNTTNFTFRKKDSINITPNYPFEKLASQFIRHKAFIVSFDISIKPGQRFIQFPDDRVALGSKYPTFSLNYTKGIEGPFGSTVNYDKWKFMVKNDKNFKLAGLLKYKLGMGGFLNSKKVYIQDFQHFNGNRSLSASEYVNSFQLARYYDYSNDAPFFVFGHLEHHLNGLITNKIPFMKRHNWNLVAGTNDLYIKKDYHYEEGFIGLENIFKTFRIDYVWATKNGTESLHHIRIGTGGIIGGSLKGNLGKKSATMNF